MWRPWVGPVSRRLPAPIRRSRFRRHARAVERANRAYLDRHGYEVKAGPFAGLRFPSETHPASFALVAKLLGVYERELHPAVESLLGEGLELLVNIGCSEGYYAAGFALRLPAIAVKAFDNDPFALDRCRHVAELNGVSDRIELRPECRPADLARLPASGVALICDCEGCEASVLDPELAPPIRRWPMIVEVHDHVDRTIADRLISRFASTHHVEVIKAARRSRPAELGFLDRRAARAAVHEYRPERMRWLWLRPRPS